MDKRKFNIITIALCGSVVLGLFAAGIIIPDKGYSDRERRTLAQFPVFSGKNLSSGKFMGDFESYAYDQFPARDLFLDIKGFVSRNIYRLRDDKGYYLLDGYVSKLEYPVNTARVEGNLKLLNSVYESFIKGGSGRVYLSVIMDKNYYLAPKGGYPVMDYSLMTESMKAGLPFAEYIDISTLLTAEDFYHSDQHWRQQDIVPVARALCQGMGAGFNASFTENDTGLPLVGTYEAQSGIKADEDRLVYLSWEGMEDLTVSYPAGTKPPEGLYDMRAATTLDGYDMFMSGAQPVIKIENPHGPSDKELVVFRDSFGSSLVPLLVPSYGRITVLDLRYINSSLIPQYADFEDADVLFLYSTLIFNNTIGS